MSQNPRSRIEIAAAGAALICAVQHESHSHRQLQLVASYAEEIRKETGHDVRGHLLRLVSEAYGSFCDSAAAGFAEWKDGNGAVEGVVVEGAVEACPFCQQKPPVH